MYGLNKSHPRPVCLALHCDILAIAVFMVGFEKAD
jgi:hypothetical protein